MRFYRRRRGPDCREDVTSGELWNGGDGLIDFNYLQQSEDEGDPVPDGVTNDWFNATVVTTDPWSATS